MKLTDQPIFIVGCERSGTTMLRLMLNEHSNIALPPQTKFSRKLYKRRLLFGDLGKAKNRDKIIQWMMQKKTNTKLIDLKLDFKILEEIWRKCRTLGEITGTVFHQYSVVRNKPRWGDKRPYYIRYIPQLIKLYPDARIIHIIRDGRDCVGSLKKMPWWRKNVMYSMLNWRYSIRMGSIAAKVYKNQFIEVRYENIIRQPENELRKICNFLNEPFEPEMITFHLSAEKNIPEYKKEWHYKTYKPLSEEFIGKGKEQLSENELKTLEWSAGRELSLWNYSVDKTHTTPSVKYFKEWVKFYANVFAERAIDRLIDIFYYHPIAYKKNN